MIKIKKYIIYVEVYFSKFLHIFNIYYSSKHIPHGEYCYSIDKEKNLKIPLESGYWFKPCKYYRKIKNMDAACVYLGFIGFNVCLYDKCKMCNKNLID